MAISGNHTPKMKADRWLTPRHILDALGPFDLDPCAAPGWPTATRHIIPPEDGLGTLTTKWEGRVWLNPPYGRHTAQWLERMADHGNGIALIFARVETDGWEEFIWRRAKAVLFLDERLTFLEPTPNGPRPAKHNSGAPSALVAYSSADARALQLSGLAGVYIATWIILLAGRRPEVLVVESTLLPEDRNG